MTPTAGRPEEVRARRTSKRFWAGIALAGAGAIVALSQIGLFAADEVETVEGPARPAGKLLRVVYSPVSPEVSRLTKDIERARGLIAEAAERFAEVDDYTCVFVKRERIHGSMGKPHIMTLKARTSPDSLYLKFVQPNQGRETIYQKGRNDGKILAHDVGLGKLLGGTMRLDPRGTIAMSQNRHPITEAGLARLIETVTERWKVELAPEVSEITIDDDAEVDGRVCTMVDSTHPVRKPEFFFYKVRLYFDRESALPIRFESYDWPGSEGAAPQLLEEYTYAKLRTNVGLKDVDFDTENPAYSFGRF